MRRWALGLAALALATVTTAADTTPAAAGSPPRLDGVIQISVGGSHACALLDSHQVRCWGDNVFGELGMGDSNNTHRTALLVRNAADTGPLTHVLQVSAGEAYTCALLRNHEVRCWGYDNDGELGDGHTDEQDLPVAVRNADDTANLGGVARIETSDGSHTCALLQNGQVRCWGANGSGELGDGSTDPSLLPVAVRNGTDTANLGGVAALAVGAFHTCALLASRQVRCWGSDEGHALGDGEPVADHHLPVPVLNHSGSGPLQDARSIATDYETECVVIGTQQARCWGYGGNGERGDDDSGDAPLPVALHNVAGTGPLLHVLQVTQGAEHGCVRVAGPEARCFGLNQYGEVGDGSTMQRNRPVVVRKAVGTQALGNVMAVDGGLGFSCFLLANQEVRCVGRNDSSQLGDDSTSEHHQVVPVLA